MKRLIVVSSLVITYCLCAFAASAEQPKPVTVENTPNVNVINTPSVSAQQSGDWNVAITGTPGVTIKNGPSEPVPVVLPVSQREPYQVQGQFELLLAVPSASIEFPVPQDKMLVIEQISSFVDFLPEPQEIVFLQFSTDAAAFYFSVPKLGPAGTIFIEGNLLTGNAYGATHQVRLYGSPGGNVRFLVERAAGQVTGFNPLVRVALSGYLIPPDSPSLAP
ncbi:MAG: hypothetical protein ACM34I_05095 [bacterium]